MQLNNLASTIAFSKLKPVTGTESYMIIITTIIIATKNSISLSVTLLFS